jgi:CRISPR-associated protein Cmr1
MFFINRFSGIERQTYEVEIITPMFLGAADPKKAELRVPPIKGMLRFWWRALHSDLVNNGNFISLKENESEIFGGAGDKYGKSKVKIFIKSEQLKIDKYNPLPHKYNPLPHRSEKSFNFDCIAKGQNFNLTLHAPKRIHNLFRFMSIVGGLGKRSRRGFGSFKIKNDNLLGKIDINGLLSLVNSVNVNNLFSLDNQASNQIIYKNSYNGDKLGYPFLKSIQIGKERKSYDKLLKDIGQASHDHNSEYTGFAKGQNRFASPIYVSVIKIESNYIPVISTLNTAFENKSVNHGSDNSLKFKNDILSFGD